VLARKMQRACHARLLPYQAVDVVNASLSLFKLDYRNQVLPQHSACNLQSGNLSACTKVCLVQGLAMRRQRSSARDLVMRSPIVKSLTGRLRSLSMMS
jgi:hypothetical protein